MGSLPLFPLGTVLMPGAHLPLQLFEPRYVALLRDLLARQEEEPPIFGVVAIRKGYEVGESGVPALFDAGCAAQVRQAADLGQQRYLIVSEGTRRFSLDRLVDGAETPYAVAEVTWWDEADGDDSVVAHLAGRLRSEVAAYRASIDAEPLDAPEDDRALSYWVPRALTLALADEQRLLESQDTETRLRLARRMVRHEHALAASLHTVARPPERGVNFN